MARHVVMVCFPGMELLDVAGPANVFAVADRLLRSEGQDGYRVELVAQTAGPLATAGGVELVAKRAISSVRGGVDTIMVGGGLLPTLEAARGILPALARISRRARRVAAVCTGAFLLAEAKLLDGKRAVTHWAMCDLLQRTHPSCRVEKDSIFVRDQRVWTSAGVSSGMDLALALVEQDHGSRLALEAARWLVMYLRRPGGQSQFSEPLKAQHTELDEVAALLSWMSNHLDADLSVEALARRVSMSVRNFSRVFRRETGSTPSAFVERLRLEKVRRELELTDRSVKQIAHASGFGTVETLHRAFQRALGTTPLQYRTRFSVRLSKRARLRA
jgi:transcriptional regulator GlxA family with amidase domain